MGIIQSTMFRDCFKQSPIHLIDVGASGGLQKHWRKFEQYLKVILFEPDKRSYEQLALRNPKRNILINSALHRNKGILDFCLTVKPEVSSIYSPNEVFLKQFPEVERFKVCQTLRMKVDSLDNLLIARNIKDIDFIKLDVQGSELAILEGAEETLKDVLGLEIEVEFAEVYRNQPLFSDIDEFMRDRGFQLFDLKPYYWKRACGKNYGGFKGQLIFADSLYFPKLESLKNMIQRIHSEQEKKAKILKAVAIVMLYGYVDYALAIFKQEQEIFSQDEIDILQNDLNKSIGKWGRIPHFPGKGKLAKIILFLYNLFRPTHKGWATSGEGLGNIL